MQFCKAVGQNTKKTTRMIFFFPKCEKKKEFPFLPLHDGGFQTVKTIRVQRLRFQIIYLHV